MASLDLSGIIVHPITVQALNRLAAAPPHGLLVSGPAGTGKILIAQRLTAATMGLDQAALIRSPFVYHIAAGGETTVKNGKGAESARQRGSIGIEQVRELIRFFTLSVPGSTNLVPQPVKRAAIIEDADLLTVEAQNALLKLLEEPPARSLLLLTSANPRQLLPTVRSRLQECAVLTPGATEVRQFFENQGYEKEVVEQAIHQTAGTPGAVNLTLNGSDGDDPAAELALVKHILSSTPFERLALIDSSLKDKFYARRIVQRLAEVASGSLHHVASGGDSSKIARWQRILSAASTADRSLRANTNSKLVLTELMLML